MSPVVRWGVIIGAAIVIVDLLTVVAAQSISPDQADLWSTLDQLANWVLLSLLGYRVGVLTGTARSAAESGVLAGAIAGVAAVLTGLAFGLERASETESIVGVIAYNVAQAGVIGLLAGFLGSRTEARKT